MYCMSMKPMGRDSCSTIQSGESLVKLCPHLDIAVLTKWFENSNPGTLALAYSKSMTTSRLCWFAGSRRGDSPGGSNRRMFPYCVYNQVSKKLQYHRR